MTSMIDTFKSELSVPGMQDPASLILIPAKDLRALLAVVDVATVLVENSCPNNGEFEDCRSEDMAALHTAVGAVLNNPTDCEDAD